MKMQISKMLKDLGISPSLRGYQYIRYCVELLQEDFSYVNNVTKKLYPEVAKKFDTTPSRVERAIRHAIEEGWILGDIDLQNKLFGYTVDQDKGKPTNSQFIATVADWFATIKLGGR